MCAQRTLLCGHGPGSSAACRVFIPCAEVPVHTLHVNGHLTLPSSRQPRIMATTFSYPASKAIRSLQRSSRHNACAAAKLPRCHAPLYFLAHPFPDPMLPGPTYDPNDEQVSLAVVAKHCH